MKRFSSIFPVVFIAAGLVGVLWPLMKPGFYVSDDGEWMVIRLSAFYQSLADGQFPVRFLGRLNNSYGYPVANFLYPGFLYIGSLLHFFGFSFVTSIKLILALGVAGSAIWIFMTLRRTFSSFAAGMGALAFIGSPYLLYDLYKRGSVGEVLAFLPASIGLYSIVASKPWLFSLAVAGLVVSHNTLALLFSLVLVVFLLTQKKKHFFRHFIVGIGMAAFFWIPAIAEKRYIRFDLVTVSDPMEYVLGIRSLWMAGVAGFVAGAVLLFFNVNKYAHGARPALAIYIISTLLALPLSGFIWSVRPVAALFQFPIRMLAVGTIMTPWLVAAVSEKFIQQKLAVTVVLLVVLAVPAWSLLQKISFVTREQGYYTTNEATTTVADEYMPRWVTLSRDDRAPDRLVFEKGRGRVVYEYLNTQRMVATVEALEESTLRLHTIYYPGWGIMIDGSPVPVTYQNPHGFMEVEIPAGTHSIEAEFRETVPRFLADLVSIGSVLAWGVLAWKGARHL